MNVIKTLRRPVFRYAPKLPVSFGEFVFVDRVAEGRKALMPFEEIDTLRIYFPVLGKMLPHNFPLVFKSLKKHEHQSLSTCSGGLC